MNCFAKKTIDIAISFQQYKSKFSVACQNGYVLLTQRELDCLYFLLVGFSYKFVARQLNISSRTVEKYVERIKDKLGCASKDEIPSLVKHTIYFND